MASKYILQHTAEAIDRKLDLIVENKNLLEYPYNSFPAEFTDVGDGSILVPARDDNYDYYSTTLASFILPAGTYTLSMTSSDPLTDQLKDDFDCTIAALRPGTSDVFASATRNCSSEDPDITFTLSEETSVDVVLYTNASPPSTDIILRPQLEKGSEITSWAPYMSTVNNYVDERFNGLNAKIRALIKANSPTSFTVGSTTLTEEQLIKILNFIDCIELES